MKHFIDAINLSLLTENWYSALALSLMLPDICGKIEYAGGSQGRYAKWFDVFVGNKYKDSLNGKIHTFMVGNDCYALRCAFFHEGTNNVSSQPARELVTEKFVIMFSRGIYIHKLADVNGKLCIFLPTFCTDIIEGVEEWMQKTYSSQDKNKIDAIESLMKIYLPDTNSHGMILSHVGNLWEEK